MSTTTSSRAIAAAILFALGLGAHAQDLSQQIEFNIPPKSLPAAIIEFSKQTGVQVVTAGEDVSTLATQGVSGRLTISEALQRLLSGTELRFRPIGDSTVALVNSAAETTRVDEQHGFRFARVAARSTAENNAARAQPSSSEDTRAERVELEEVLVTGSHIRGATSLSSPVITFDRQDIEAGGFTTTQQLVQKLPQNLNSVSDTTQANLNGGVGYAANPNGAAVNLRGLGGDATLVLLNGRRLAAAGNGTHVDISLVPLSAIERVEVLTDGASAIYGADAVGGVVNLVLRDDFEGFETRVRYGSVSSGDHNEWQAAQTVGHSWGSGHAFVSYDYLRRTPLASADRRHLFSSTNMPSTDLVPGQKRHGAIAVFDQALSDRVELSGNVFYAQRSSPISYTYNFGMELPQEQEFDVEQLGGALGLKVDIGSDWQARVSGVIDRTNSRNQLFNGLTRQRTFSIENDFRVWSVDVAADGPVMRAPGGDVRLAIGSHARNEDFRQDSGPDYQAQLDRDNKAVYAEVLVPWITASNRRAGIEHLELTLAGRYEDYSDFGNTFNPKIGMAWSPVRGLNVRGTWGTSFKAPLLNQMTHGDLLYLMDGMFRDEVGLTTALQVTGNGVNLGPEESRNWTAGFDFTPQYLPQLSISATYFNIDYEDRINQPLPAEYDLPGILLDPNFASIVTRNPALAEVEQLIAGAISTTCYSYITSDYCNSADEAGRVAAIVDTRLRNLSSVKMDGIDFTVGYRLSTKAGEWGISIAGSKLLSNRSQLIAGVPPISELNNVWVPVDLRLRNTLSYSREPLSIVAAINYTDGYSDSRPQYIGSSEWRENVSSWTTVDFTVRYDLSSLWRGVRSAKPTLTLNALNLFDRDPPYVANFDGFRYDGVNANALGRFVSAQIDLRW